MKKVTVDELKLMLRESGVKQKRNMYGNMYIVSSALTKSIKDKLSLYCKQTGTARYVVLNRAILKFKPVNTDIKMFLTPSEIKSTVGYLDRPKPDKVFGNRANIKFTSFTVEPINFTKLNELSEYYGVSRSGLIRLILEDYLNEKT